MHQSNLPSSQISIHKANKPGRSCPSSLLTVFTQTPPIFDHDRRAITGQWAPWVVESPRITARTEDPAGGEVRAALLVPPPLFAASAPLSLLRLRPLSGTVWRTGQGRQPVTGHRGVTSPRSSQGRRQPPLAVELAAVVRRGAQSPHRCPLKPRNAMS